MKNPRRSLRVATLAPVAALLAGLDSVRHRLRRSPAVQEFTRDFRALVRRACRANLAFGKYAVTLLLVSYLSTPQLFAAVVTWDVTPGDGATIDDGAGTWSLLLGNFNNAGVDGLWVNGDDAIFGGGTAGAFGTVTLGSAITVGNITFNTPFGGGAYTIDTDTFGLTINTGITANEDATITTATGSVILGGNNIWNVAATKTLTVNSVVTDGASSFSLDKQGTGTLVLAGAGTYDGGVTITAGALRATHNTALGTGAATVATGAALELANGITVANLITLNGTGVTADGALRNISGANEATGAITLGSDSRINSDSGTLTLSGGITGGFNLTFGGAGDVLVNSIIGTGAGNLTKDGTGVLTLSAANTYTGTTLVSGGVLRLDTASALPGGIDTAVGGGESALTLGGGVLGLGAGDFTRALGTGAGQVQFTASSGFAAYGAARNVNLNGNGTPDLMTWVSTASFLGLGQSLILGAASANNTVTFQNPIDFNGAVRTIQVDDGSAATDAVLSGVLSSTGIGGFAKDGGGTLSLTAANTFTGGVTVNSGVLLVNNAAAIDAGNALIMNGGTLRLNGFNQTVAGLSGVGGTVENGVAGQVTLTVNKGAGPVDVFSGVLADGAPGSLALAKTGAGTLQLTGVNTFTGNISVSGGTLSINGPGGTLEAPALGAPGRRDITLSSGGAFQVATGTFNPGVNTKQFIIGSGGGTFDIPATAALSLDDAGQLQGSGDVTKIVGDGTLTVRNANNFTGKMIVDGGHLNADGTAFGTELRMGAGTVLALGVNISTNTLIQFNGDTTISNAFRLNAPNVQLGAGAPRVLTVLSTEVEFSGPISVGVGLTKAGTGRLTLSGANTYTGPTEARAGVLLLNNALALPGGIGAAGGTGNLTLAATAGNNPIIGLGDGNFTRPLGIGATDVQFTGTAGGAGFAAFGGDRAVNFGGAGALVTWGAGSFVPTGVNLVLGNGGAVGRLDLQNPIDLNLGVRTVEVIESPVALVDARLSGIISGGALSGLTKTGTGTLALTGVNTYSGVTTVSAGALRVQGATALGATGGGNNTLVSSGAALELDSVGVAGELLTLNGAGISPGSGALRNLAGNNAWTGAITLGAGSRINSDAGTLTLSGGITGPTFALTVGGAGNVTINSVIGTTTGTLIKDGAGNLTLSAANTYTGSSTINRGTLHLDYTAASSRLSDTTALILGGGTVVLTNGATTEIVGSTTIAQGGSSVVRGTGTSVLRMNTITRSALGGTVKFGAASIADSDNTLVNGILGGWATVGNEWATITAPGTDQPIIALATYGVGAETTWVGGTINAKPAFAVGSTTALTAARSLNSLNLVTTGTAGTDPILNITNFGLTLTSGGLLLSGTDSAVIAGGTGTLTAGPVGSLYELIVGVIASRTLQINAIIANNGVNAVSLTKSDAGTLTLRGINTYSGNNFLNGGVVDISAESGLGAVPGGVVAGNITMNGGQLILTTSGAALGLSANRGVTLNAGGGTISASSTANNATISGIIAGAGALTKVGAGKLVLGGVNTFTGPTTVTAGTLVIAAESGLGGTPTAVNTNHLTLNGGALQVTANTTLSPSRGVFLGASGGTFNVDSGFGLSANSIITGPGALIKTGSGTNLMNGSNSYTGKTSVPIGTVSINTIRNVGANNFSSLGAPTTVANGTITMGGGSTNTALIYTGTGDTTDRIIELAGTTGSVTIDQTGPFGLLRFTGAFNATGAGAKTLVLQGSTIGTGEIAGVIADNGGANVTHLFKNGSSRWTLTGANTFSGGISNNAGVLAVTGAGSVAASTVINVAGTATSLQLGDVTDTAVVNRVGDGTTITLNNAASLILNGTTFVGTTTEDVGQLNLGTTSLANAALPVSVTLNPGAGQDVQLQSDALLRIAGVHVLLRGTGLGTAAGANTSRIKFDTAPLLLGGGGAAGTPTISVVPFAAVDTSATGTGGNSLATYDSALGLRLINLVTEVDTTLIGAANRNINLTANSATAGDQTIGSLRIAGGDLTITGTDTLANTSGAILFASGNTITGPGTLAAGHAEIVLHAPGGAGLAPALNANVSGTGGLTVNLQTNNTLLLGGNNTFTGPITLNSGTVKLASANALGQGTLTALNPVRLNLGVLDLNGQNAVIGRLDGAGGAAGNITNSSSSPASLSVNTFAGASTYAPVIQQGTGSGAISLIKEGANNLTLSGASTITGSVDVRAGQLTLSGTLLNLAGGITVRNGATFVETTGVTTGRIGTAAPVGLTLVGGTFNFNNSAGAFNTAENFNVLTLNSGGSTINANRANSGQTSTLTFASMTRSAGATINFTGASLGADTRNAIAFTSAPTPVSGIYPFATVNSADFATYNGTPSIGVATYTDNPLEAALLTGVNVRYTASPLALAGPGPYQVNSLNFAPAAAATTLDLGTFSFRVESGGVLNSGRFDSTIANGSLTAGLDPVGTPGELIFHSYSSLVNQMTVSANIVDNGAGAVSVTKTGSGTLLLSGANLFSGQLTLNGGTLRLGASAIPGANAVTLNGGTFASSDGTARSITGSTTIGGDTVLGQATVGTGALNFSGPVGINGAVRTLTVNNPSANVNTISGLISGTGGLAKSGPGLLSLNGLVDNTYAGITLVNQGTLRIDNTTLTADRSPLGSGQLRFGGGTVQIAGGGVGSYADIVTSANVNAGHSQITTTGSPTYVLRLNTLSASTGGTLDFGAASIAQVDNANVNGILGAYATVGGANWAMNSAAGDGPVTAYAGYTTGGGTDPLGWTALQNLTFAASPLFVTNNASANSLRITTGSALGVAAGKILTLDSGGILNTGTGLSSVSGGILRGGGPQNELVIHQYNTSQPLLISALIANNASGSGTALVKSGPGELIIANTSNTFSGVKYLNGGTVTINPSTLAEGTIGGTPGPLGAVPAVAQLDLVINGGTLALGPLTVAGQGGIISDNRNIRLDDNGGTLVSPSISGVPRVFQTDPTIFGVGSLTLSGNGGFLLNENANTYSGGTILNANAIVMPNANGVFGTGPVTLNDGAILTVWANTGRTIANPMSILGNVTLGYSGVTGGTLSTGFLTLSGPVDLGGGTRVITADAGRTNIITGVIANGVLTKSGAGTLSLTGANTFSGPITVNNGLFNADTTNNATVLNTSAALVVGGGTFRLTGVTGAARSQILNGLTLNAGSSVVDVNNLTGATSTTLDLRGVGGAAVITRNAGSTVDFRATTGGALDTAVRVIKTAQPNDASGILGGWATANSGTNFAKVDGSGNIVSNDVHVDVIRLTAGGVKTITSSATANIRFIEGTGAPLNITPAAPGTTDINTLLQSAAGGTGAAIYAPAVADVLRLGLNGAILISPGAGALTIGVAVNDGFLTAGGAPNTASDLILNNSSANTMTINSIIQDNGTGAISLVKAGTGAGAVLLNSAGTYTGDTIIGAGILRLGAADRIPNGATFGNVTVNGTLDLNDFSETINGLNGYGTINNVAGVSTRTLTIGDNNASGNFTGVILAGTGTTGLTKVGSGTQTFGGHAAVSTYTGPTLIENGALRVEGGFDRLPVATTVTLGSGGNTGKLIVARDQTVAGIATTGLGGSVVGGSTDVATFTVNLAADATYSGLLGGGLANENNLGLAKSGGAVLTLASANTMTGPVTVNAGTLTLSGASGALASANGVTVFNGGTLTLNNTTFNGNRLSDTAPITLVAGGTTTFNFLNDGVTTGNYTETLGPLVIVGSSGTVTIDTTQAETGSATSTSTLTFSSLSLASGVSLVFSGTGVGDTDENRIFITGMADGAIIGAKVGLDDAQYNSVLGVHPLAIFNTDYTVNSHPGGGSLAGTPGTWVATDKANPAGGVRFTAAANVTLVSLKLNNDGSVNTPGYNAIDLNGGSLTLTGNSIGTSGAAAQSIINGTLTAGTGGAANLALATLGANQLTISAVIANNGGGVVSLTKSGTGTLVLSGVNTFTGKTTISQGTLSIIADSGLGVVPGGAVADQLTISGGTLLLGNGVALAANRGVTLGVSHGTVNVAGTDSASINGIIAGALRNLTKTGTGTLILGRANTFTGSLIVNGGTLVGTTNAGALGNGAAANAVTLTSGTLRLQNDTPLLFARNTTVNGNSAIEVDRLNAGAGVTSTTNTLGTLSIGGQTLTISSGPNITSGIGGLFITGAATLTGAPTFTVNNNGNGSTTILTLGNTVLAGANLLTFNGSGNSTVNGVITGSAGLTHSGSGVLTLVANNGPSLSGPVNIGSGGGTLAVSSSGSLGTAAVTINGGTLAATATVTPTNNFTVANNFSLGQVGGANSTMTLLGTVDLGGSDRTITVNNTTTIRGVISSTGGGLTKTGSGTLTLQGVNTYTGPTGVRGGTLVQDNSIATASASGITALNDHIPSGSALTLGNGTLRLNGRTSGTATTTGAVATWANASRTVTLSSAVAGLAPGQPVASVNPNFPAGAFIVSVASDNLSFVISVPTTGAAGGVTEEVTATANSFNTLQTFNGLTLNAGVNVVDANHLGGAGGSATIDLRGAGTAVITRNPGSVVDFRATTGGPLTAISLAKVQAYNAGAGLIGGFATVNSGADLAFIDGSGNVIANPTYTDLAARGPGSTIADAAASNVRINTIGLVGNIALGASTVNINTLMQNTATPATVDTAGKTLRLGTTGAILLTSTANGAGIGLTIGAAVNDGTLTAGGGPADTVADEIIVHNNSTSALAINAVVADNGGDVLSLTKVGTGALTLAGANTFTGGVRLNAGALNINNASALGTAAGTFVIGAGTTINNASAAAITTPNHPLTINGNVTFTGTRDLNLGTGAATLGTEFGTNRTVTVSAGALTLGGVIGNGTTAIGLSKAGNGTLTLGGANTFTGGVTLTAGQLNINHASALGNAAGPVLITAGTLDNTSGAAITTGNHPITIDGNFAFTGGSGTTRDLNLGVGAITLGTAAGTTRTITATNGTLTLGGSIANGATATGLIKAGLGTLVLGGASTFNGGVTVNGGTLVADTTTAGTVLNSANALTLAGATFRIDGTAATARSQTLNGLTVNAGVSVVDANNLGTSTILDLRGAAGTGVITRAAGGMVDFKATTGGPLNTTTAVIKTAQANVNGILGAWATVNGGTDLATRDANSNIVAYTGYTDVTRQVSGPQTITSATASNVRIIEGSGGAGSITPLAAGTTDINTLVQSVSGGTGTATYDPGTTDILRVGLTGGILMVPTAGDLTIGVTAGDGILTAGGAVLNGPGELILNNASVGAMTINSIVDNNGIGVVSVTKSGTGALTLNSTNTYTGPTVINAGAVTIGGAGLLGAGTYAGTVSLGSGASLTYNSSAAQALNGVISGLGSLTQAGAGSTLTLGAANTFNGGITVSGGILTAGIANAFGATALPNTLTVGAAGTVRLNGFNNNVRSLNGPAGAIVENSHAATAATLTVDGTGTDTYAGLLQNGGVGLLNVAKSGLGSLTLTAANTYGGSTAINNGSLILGVDNALPSTTGLSLGTGGTVGTLDMAGFNQTVGSLAVNANSALLVNQITIAPAKTLTVTGNVTVGPNTAGATTRFTASGGGNLSVSSATGAFQVGGVTGANAGGVAIADLSGLASFTLAYGSGGTFRLGDNNSDSAAVAPSSLRLATANTITVGTVRIGDGSGGTANHTLTLGSGANVINATTVNIGSAGSGIRSSGTLAFDGADTTGTLTLRGFAGGVTRTVLNMVNSTGSTASDMTSTANLSGHTADIMASTLTMATRSDNIGGTVANLSFDQGILDVTTLNMASRTGTGTGNANATLNLGDSAAPGVPTVTIGGITMAVNTSAGGTSTATLNITGGNVAIGTGSGTAINMANAGTLVTAGSALNITGGTVTVTGDIIRTVGLGTETATLALNGASAILDMSGNDITSLTGITYTDGTLRNLGIVNTGLTMAGSGARVFDQATAPSPAGAIQGHIQGAITGTGVGLTKQGLGNLKISGANTYDGVTTISGGILLFGNQVSLYNNVVGDWTDTKLVVESGATAAFNVGGAGEFTSADIDILKVLGTATGGFKNGSAIGLDTTGAGGTFTYGSVIADTFAGANRVGLTKLGTGTLELNGASANTYSGLTTVSGGVLDLNKPDGVNAISSNIGGAGNDKIDDVLVNGGTLRLLQNNQIIDTASINVATGGTLNFNGFNETVYNLNNTGGIINYGVGDVVIDDPTWGVGGVNNITGNTTFGSLFIEGGAGGLNGDNIVFGTAGGGPGRLRIGTVTTPGPINFGNGLANGTPTLTLNSDAATPGRLQFAAGLAVSLTFTGTGTSTGLITSAGVGANAGEVDLNGSDRTFNIGDAAGSSVDMAISARIVDNTVGGGVGPAGLIKTGLGTLQLSGANAYSGKTTVNNGRLSISSDDNLGTAPGAAVADQLKLDGGYLQTTANLSLNVNRGVTIGSGNGIILTDTATTLTVPGVVAGTGSLSKTGAGTLELTGANTYGKTTVSGGVLSISSDGNLGTAPGAPVADQLTIESSGVLRSTANMSLVANRGVTLGVGTPTIETATATTLTAAGIVTGGGDLTKTGAGTLELTAANTYTGKTTVSAGVLSISTDGNLGTAPGSAVADQLNLDGGTLLTTGTMTLNANRGVTLGAGNGTIETAAATTLSVAGVVAGPGSLTKTGSGTAVLNGVNTFTGSATVSSGTLELGVAGALGGTSGITVNGGTLLLSSTGDRINDTATMNLTSGTFNTAGTSETLGVLTLSGNSTIDLASGASILTFADSTGTWTSTLSVWNWTGTPATAGGTDQLIFSSAVNIAGNVNQISFYSGAGSGFLGTGLLIGNEVVPVPEPATWLAIFAVLGLLGWRERRRLVALVQRVRGQ